MEAVEVDDGNTKSWRLKHEFVFYSSALPCGDASIVEMNQDENSDVAIPAKRARTGILDDFRSERVLDGKEDVYRTGARVVEGNDPKGAGHAFHRLGVSRTKGGRGPQSISMSCSGKNNARGMFVQLANNLKIK